MAEPRALCLEFREALPRGQFAPQPHGAAARCAGREADPQNQPAAPPPAPLKGSPGRVRGTEGEGTTLWSPAGGVAVGQSHPLILHVLFE